jgi:SAM-dependent methyltransferase
VDDTVANREQAAYWESRAASWIDAEGYTALVGGPFGRAAIEALGPASGWRVLDVGCGTGPTTVELARRVAPGGSVLGVDIAPSMLDAARDRARREGVDGIGFRVADAQAHELGDGEFDGVFSQFGVMFFEDPAVAFANLRRSLRDGGRLGFACWQELFANEWMFVPGAAALAVTGGPPNLPGPGRPGPFSLCDPAVVADLLGSAGFADVDVSPVSDPVDLPADRLDDAVDASCGVGAAREALEATSDPELRDAIRGAVHDALAERVTDGRIRLGAAAHVVTARA